MTSPVPRVKEPHLAGRWYPAAPEELAARLRRLLAAAGPPRAGTCAIVVPHATLDHAGAVAARGWAAAAGGAWRRVVVLAPSHYARFRGVASLPMDAYRTPLGAIAIDADGPRSSLVRPNPALFLREHAVETQLPWLRAVAPDAAALPLLVGSLEPNEAAALAEALRVWTTADTLLVASSDLVHYGRRFAYLPVPPTDRQTVEAAVRRLDDDALACIAAGDADGFVRHVGRTGVTVCGRDAIDILLRALPPGTTGSVLAHATSLDGDGDYEHTVGYGAVAFAAPPA